MNVLEQAFAPSAEKALIDSPIVDEPVKEVSKRLGILLPLVLEMVEREIKPLLA